ncbi:hypothetical protein EDD18DRAFT_1360382 [Armillaria luteobubalina]|uniref:Uncharacterized protein n=1 Tax=Armillaria luteobubalina TaxID=153913 RepID=A0AA39PLZ0_9AGAR|nr:hypothetical protein EDD18DRAFT_1360382 [Armillaria luteobubalina]
MKELRTLLLPLMRNSIRRLVIECVADGFDAVRKACKMSVDDVVHELRDEARGGGTTDLRRARLNNERELWKKAPSGSSDDSSLFSRSDGSTTSPALSTSTLQTTPSPPSKEADFDPSITHFWPSTAVENDSVYSGTADPSAGAELGGFPRDMERHLRAALPLNMFGGLLMLTTKPFRGRVEVRRPIISSLREMPGRARRKVWSRLSGVTLHAVSHEMSEAERPLDRITRCLGIPQR